jgi:hypothetical protein
VNNKQASQLQELLDREAIRDVVWRYCHGVDRADKAVLETIYWPEAIETHGEYVGSASGFIGHALNVVNQVESIQHLIGNTLIRVVGSHANVESSFFCYQVMPAKAPDHPDYSGRPGPGPCSLFLGGRYLDRFECRAGEWRILHRTVAFDWWRILDGAADRQLGLTGTPVPMGSFAPGDLSYRLFSGGLLDPKPAS